MLEKRKKTAGNFLNRNSWQFYTVYKLLNPESALDFVTKLNYSIKASTHGLFLNEKTKFSEYLNKYSPMN
jgi:hypothetical protein